MYILGEKIFGHLSCQIWNKMFSLKLQPYVNSHNTINTCMRTFLQKNQFKDKTYKGIKNTRRRRRGQTTTRYVDKLILTILMNKHFLLCYCTITDSFFVGHPGKTMTTIGVSSTRILPFPDYSISFKIVKPKHNKISICAMLLLVRINI